MISRARLKFLQSLGRKKVRRDEGKLLVEGVHVVEEALARDCVEELYLAEDLKAPELVESGVDVQRLSAAEVMALSDTKTPAGAFALVRNPVEPLVKAKWGGLATMLLADGVADPGNLGTLIRSAAALGCDAVTVTEGTVEPTNPKVVRATAGAFFRIPVYAGTRFQVRSAEFRIWIADARGDFIDSIEDRPPRLALLVGNEPRGVDPEATDAADRAVAVPLHGGVESLNVAVAAGILMHAIQKMPVSHA
ncbi:MAG: TrmH family RNA methyltransferase [Planctomycetota bacterium]